MAVRRQFEPAVEIFQDPRPPYDPAAAYQSVNMQHHMLPPQHHSAALQPVPHYIQNRNAMYQQQQQHAHPQHIHPQHNYAPLKSHSNNTSPKMQMQHPPSQLNTVYLAPPEMSGYVSGSPMKKDMHAPQPHPQQYAAYYAPATQRPDTKALFNTFPATNTTRQTPDKENMYHLNMYEAPHFAPPYLPQSQTRGKRAAESDIMSSASHDRTAKRFKPDEEEENLTLPDPEEMPALKDDGGKPPFSYASLIGMAILRAPNRRLTLSQIYKWISDTFSWYRDAEPGWMNSIRHNLSLNKAFVKKERPKDDPGKGNYWAIEEGMEKQFLKDKNNTRRVENQPAYVQTMSADTLRPITTAPMVENVALPPPPKHGRIIDSSRFPGENEASSDATLPDDQKNDEMMPPPSRVVASSPPHAPFDSSPPVHLPQLGSAPVLGRQQGRKPLKETFRDSGFFSSIESSVPRHKAAEPDREDVRSSALRGSSGRAEEELARIRGSSYDPSPTRAKSAMGHRQYKELTTPSSPTRTFDTVGFPPLTPAVKLAPPVRSDNPAATVSPNTNLRRHREAVRELVGTPAQNLPTYGLEEQWTPAFSPQHHDSEYTGSTPRFEPGSAYTPGSAGFTNTYGLLWNDDISCGGGNIGSSHPSPGALRRASDGKPSTDETYDMFFARGSPLKPAIKRPLIQRPTSTNPTSKASTALASITGTMPPPSSRSSLLGSPFRSAANSGPRPAAGFLGHVRSISRGSKDFGAAFVNSPLRRELAQGSDDSPTAPATPVRKSGLNSGVTVNSPGDSLSIWDAYLAGLEDDEEEGEGGAQGHGGSLNAVVPGWMEESKDVEGLDLAKGFSSIGAGLGGGVSALLATPMQPPTPQRSVPAQQPQVLQQVQTVAGHAVRPSMMRRVTSQL